MIFAGKLDTPVIFKSATNTADDTGGFTETWATVLKSPTRAEFMPLRGRELIEMGKVTSKSVFKLRIRRSSVINTACRVVVRGMTARIMSIEDYGRQNDMVLWCEATEVC